MTHKCHAYQCKAAVPPRMLMCKHHWSLVPKNVQRAIWATYRRGQEQDKRPSDSYLAVQRVAVSAVAGMEGHYNIAFALGQRACQWAWRADGDKHGTVVTLVQRLVDGLAS